MVACRAFAACALLLVHSAFTVYHYQVEEIEWLPWRQMFDVDEENKPPNLAFRMPSGSHLVLGMGCGGRQALGPSWQEVALRGWRWESPAARPSRSSRLTGGC